MIGRVLRSWRVAVGLAVLVVVIVGVDPAAVHASLADADPGLVLIGVLGLTAAHVVPAAGWRAIHGRTTGRWLSWRATVELSYAAQAIGGVTPANVGSDLHRATVLRRGGHDWGSAVAPLVLQRATSVVALSALAIAAAAFLAARAPEAGGLSVVGAGLAVAAAGIAWVLVVPPKRLAPVRDRLTGGKVPPLVGIGGAAAIGIGTGLAFHAAAIGLTGLLVLAVEPAAPLVSVVAALAVARLALTVPITPSGLGIQEGVLAVLFAALGLAAGVALAAMLLARVALVLTTLIGVVLLLRSRHGTETHTPQGEQLGAGDAPTHARPTTKNVPLVRG